ncbi:putative late blight resistance protein homolog R1B-16 [Solanum verrucosum]|uniref:putative late blight resistance protein homolog R1B-16 n=1 Tax=Solanum verrucosum TaxID=315347 RepID=UPI0020D039C6|nr:putative late blight resistance protein homolog R1B-16 [Solanum verrucosum]
MNHKDIECTFDHLRRIMSGGNLNSVKIDQIETLEMELRFFTTFLKYHHVLLPDSLVKITKKAQLIAEMLQSFLGGIPNEYQIKLNIERLVSQLWELTEGNTSLRYNYEFNDSYLLEYMDCLDKNLNDVPMCVDRSDLSLKNEKLILQENRFSKQVKILQKKMRFLRYLYATEIRGYVDHEKLECLEILIHFMANDVAQFCLAVWVNDGDEVDDDIASDEVDDYLGPVEDEDEIDDILSRPPYLLCLIALVELEMKKIFHSELKASKFTQSRNFKDKKLPKEFSKHLYNLLMSLRNKKMENFCNNVYARNIDVEIEFLLIFLSDVPNRFINGKRLKEILEKAGVLVGDVLYVIQKILPSSIIKDDSSKINLFTKQILEKTENLKAQVERYYRSFKFIPSQFPAVGGLSFLVSLLRKMNEMLKLGSGLNFMIKPHIVILERELSYLNSTFRDIEKLHHEHEDILRATINLAYEAEVAIDSILVQYNGLWHIFCSLPAIIKEIKHISVKVTEMRLKNIPLKPFSMVEPSKHIPDQHHNSLMNDEDIVGFGIVAEKMIHSLTRGTNELDVIPIVGMGGQGKTTCARLLYNNKIIVSHFDVRAWCVISQTYNRKELLQDIFSQVIGFKVKVDEVGELADMLRKSLLGKRYFIVLDDMWDGMAWDDLRLSLQDGENRSRIVVTTRLEKVGEYVKHHTNPYFLPFLTLKESWELLKKRVFHKRSCPFELYDVSLEVARRCKGLPLVVILVAGIIKKKMEESWWHEVKDALFSYLGESEEYSRETMHLSYDNLPDYLKPCLLYMGMFPEDHNISASTLTNLWIAEGFVQNVESGRLEEAAEGYLMDLISSNVVMVSKRGRYNGKVKYCQVHDIVLHFCLERSREERFMLAVKGNYSNFKLSDWKESRVSFSFSYELSEIASKTRKPFHQHLRSLRMTLIEGEVSNWNSFSQFSKLRLLKVLNLSSHIVGHLSSATLQPLIHLKYLAVCARKFDFHPESLLPHIETLIVLCPFMHTVLPPIFWKMKTLRHVEINDAVFDLKNNKKWISEESSKLENLRLLKQVAIKIGGDDNVDVLLRRCPNLQELEIGILCDEDSVEICQLESLTQLQILRLSIDSFRLNVSKLHLPSNLKKLVLWGARIEDIVSSIGGLPSLEYLQLVLPIFVQLKEWCLGDVTFHKLKLLKLEYLNISRWDASEESFPLLERLVIKKCHELEEIPLGFADIQTLKRIKLVQCKNKSLEASALKIKEEAEAIGGSDIIDLIVKVSGNKLLCESFEFCVGHGCFKFDNCLESSTTAEKAEAECIEFIHLAPLMQHKA